jgi:hypothetical protein
MKRLEFLIRTLSIISISNIMSKYFTLQTFNNRKLTSSVRAEKKLTRKEQINLL